MPIKRLKFSYLDRYLIFETLGPFFGSLIFFLFVFLMFQALRLAEFFIVHGIPFLVVLKMVLLLALSFLPHALPLAFLISVLVGFGRLSSDSELVAFKAAGINLWRMAIPVFVLSLIVGSLSLSLNMNLVPKGLVDFKSTLIKLSGTRVSNTIKAGTFTRGFFDLLIYTDEIDPKTNILTNVFIYDEREKSNPLVVVAKKGNIIPIKTDSELGSASILQLRNGSIHRVDPDQVQSDDYQKIDFKEYRLYLSFDEETGGFFVKPKMLTWSQLKKEKIKSIQTKNDHWTRTLDTELWRRFSIALSPMVFTFLGIGFGTVRTRSVKSGAALVSFGVVISYWFLFLFFTGLSTEGKLPAWLSMQMPNLIIALFAFFALKKANW